MMLARDPYLIGFAAMTPFIHVGALSDRLAAKALGGREVSLSQLPAARPARMQLHLGQAPRSRQPPGASYLVLQFLR